MPFIDTQAIGKNNVIKNDKYAQAYFIYCLLIMS